METNTCLGDLELVAALPDELTLTVSWSPLPGSQLPSLPAGIRLTRQRLSIPLYDRDLPLIGCASDKFRLESGHKLWFVYAYDWLYVILEGVTGLRILKYPAQDHSLAFLKRPLAARAFSFVGSPVVHSTSDTYSAIAAALMSGGVASYAEAHHVETLGSTGWEIGQIHAEGIALELPIGSYEALNELLPLHGFPNQLSYRNAIGQRVFPNESRELTSVPLWDVSGHVVIARNYGCQSAATSLQGHHVLYSGDSDYTLSLTEFTPQSQRADGYPNDNSPALELRKRPVASNFYESTGQIRFQYSAVTRPRFVRVLGREGHNAEPPPVSGRIYPPLFFDEASFVARISAAATYRPQTGADYVYPSSPPQSLGTAESGATVAGQCDDCTQRTLRTNGVVTLLDGGEVLRTLPSSQVVAVAGCQSSQQTGNVSEHSWLKMDGNIEQQSIVELWPTDEAERREDYLLFRSLDGLDVNSANVVPAIQEPLGGKDAYPISSVVEVVRQGSPSQNELAEISIYGPPRSGTFVLQFGGQESPPIPWGATIGDLQAATDALLGTGNSLVLLLAQVPLRFSVEFVGSLALTNVGALGVDTSGLVEKEFSYTPPRLSFSTELAIAQAADPTHNHAVRLDLSGLRPGGSYRFTFDGAVSSAVLESATATKIKSTLEAMSSVDVVSVTAEGDRRFLIEFQGSHANAEQPPLSVSFASMSFVSERCRSDYRNCPGSLLQFAVDGVGFHPQALRRDFDCPLPVSLAYDTFLRRGQVSLLSPAGTGLPQYDHTALPGLSGPFVEGSYLDCCEHARLPEPDASVDSGFYTGKTSFQWAQGQRSCVPIGGPNRVLVEAWWPTVTPSAIEDYAVARFAPSGAPEVHWICNFDPGFYWTPSPYAPLTDSPSQSFGDFCGVHQTSFGQVGPLCGGAVGLPSGQCLWVVNWPADFASQADVSTRVVSAVGPAGAMSFVNLYDFWKRTSNSLGQATGFSLIPGSFGPGPARTADYSYLGNLVLRATFPTAERLVRVELVYTQITQVRRPVNQFRKTYVPVPPFTDVVFAGKATLQTYEVGIVTETVTLRFEASNIDADECLRPNSDRLREVPCAFVSETVERTINKNFTAVSTPEPPDKDASIWTEVPAPFPDLATYPISKLIQVSPSASVTLSMTQRGLEPVGYPEGYLLSLANNMGPWSGDHALDKESFENHWLKEIGTSPFVSILLVPGWYLLFFEDRDGQKVVAAKYRLSCRDRIRAQWNRYGVNELELVSCNQELPWPEIIQLTSNPLTAP